MPKWIRPIICFLLFSASLRIYAQPGGDLILIHVFRADWNEMVPHPARPEILSPSSRSELAALGKIATGSEPQIAAVAFDSIMDLYGLESIDDLFFLEKEWSGDRTAVLADIVKTPGAYFRIELTPKKQMDRRILLRIRISRGQGFLANAETIVDEEPSLAFGEPAIIIVPYRNQAFFVLALIRPKAVPDTPVENKKGRKTEIVSAPPVIIRVPPIYPNELRRRRIGGEVGLLVKIDEKGKAVAADVERPAHPYLNYSAVQSVLKWSFEPVQAKDKAIPAVFRLSVGFFPDAHQSVILSGSPWPESGRRDARVLEEILSLTGEYCRKLSQAALYFVCEETIKETHFSLRKNIKKEPILIVTKQGEGAYDPWNVMVHSWIQIIDPTKTKRNTYLCDYQIIRKEGVLTERRFLLKKNGRPNADKTEVFEEKRISGLSPLFAPLRVLLPDRQPNFFFRIASEEKIQGRKTFLIEARPKSEDEDGIWSARLWVDQENYRILKCEIEGIPIDGYEDVLDDCAALNIRPEFVTTHEYQDEKGGIIFPRRSKIRISYPGYTAQMTLPKTDVILSYGKFRFFTVDSEHRILQ